MFRVLQHKETQRFFLQRKENNQWVKWSASSGRVRSEVADIFEDMVHGRPYGTNTISDIWDIMYVENEKDFKGKFPEYFI